MRKFDADSMSRRQFAVPASDEVFFIKLAAGAASQPVPVKAGAGVVAMHGTTDFRFRFGAGDVVAGLPALTSTNGTASDVMPGGIKAGISVPAGATHLGLIAAADCDVTLAWFAIAGAD